jgi:hypothetical protein
MRILGIDPGLDGGIAMMDGSRLVIEQMPTTGGTKRSVDAGRLSMQFAAWILDEGIEHAFLERVGARPQGGGRTREPELVSGRDTRGEA